MRSPGPGSAGVSPSAQQPAQSLTLATISSSHTDIFPELTRFASTAPLRDIVNTVNRENTHSIGSE